MNDQKLRRRLSELRVPPANPAVTDQALERVLEALAQPLPEHSLKEAWTWRDWLWPSPVAWGAMAALWMLVGVHSSDRPNGASARKAPASEDALELPPNAVFASSDYSALLREIQQRTYVR